MKHKKIKSALYRFLKSIDTDQENQAKLFLITSATQLGYESVTEAIIDAMCHKKLSHQDYRWLKIKHREIHIFYGGKVVRDRVSKYGHLIIGLRNDPNCRANRLVINVHRRPFSASSEKRVWRIPPEELLRLNTAKASLRPSLA